MLTSFEKGKHTFGVFINLPKMFITFEHNILLQNLVINVIREKYLYWFESYQKRRHQFVSVGKTVITASAEIICDLAQGSIV